MRLTLTTDTTGNWRRGYTGHQWDSTSGRNGTDLRQLAGLIQQAQPTAAKDISMAGLVGTTGMLAEASGCAAVLEVGAIPKPPEASMGDWLTCFPGYTMITADAPGTSRMNNPLIPSAECGELVPGSGVTLRWPDGMVTDAISHTVTGLGRTQP